MGLLSTLGKIGAGIAAPFTGGASLAAIPMIDAIGGAGQVLGKQQGAESDALLKQGQLTNSANNNAIGLYSAQNQAQNQQAQTDLERKKYDAEHQNTSYKQELLAQLLGHAAPTQVSVAGIPNAQISGGLSDMITKNPGILSLLSEIASKSHTDATTPLSYQGGQSIAAPTLAAMPQASGTSGVLSNIARIAQFAPLLKAFLPKGETGDGS